MFSEQDDDQSRSQSSGNEIGLDDDRKFQDGRNLTQSKREILRSARSIKRSHCSLYKRTSIMRSATARLWSSIKPTLSRSYSTGSQKVELTSTRYPGVKRGPYSEVGILRDSVSFEKGNQKLKFSTFYKPA